MESYCSGGCFVAFLVCSVKGPGCSFLKREDILAMQEYGWIIAFVWSYGSFSFSLSFSQAEAEEKKKAEAKARSKRESGKAPSYAVSSVHSMSPTWHYNLNTLRRV